MHDTNDDRPFNAGLNYISLLFACYGKVLITVTQALFVWKVTLKHTLSAEFVVAQ
jgi:hypothetical protein